MDYTGPCTNVSKLEFSHPCIVVGSDTDCNHYRCEYHKCKCFAHWCIDEHKDSCSHPPSMNPES